NGDPKLSNHPPMLQITTTINGSVYPNNPFDATVVEGLANVYVTVGGTDYTSDIQGNATIPVNPGSAATIALEGPWAKVNNNGTTPSFTVNLADGQNTISFDNNSSINDRCAYRAVQHIHDFHKVWMPTFTGMDFQLPTNVDLTGTCNAFYDGSSINFYAVGGGCNAASLVADICHHEYGHGINDNFYTSIGGFFQNGAIGEAYADFWAISLNNNPLLGAGFNTDNMDPIRRYDIDPKVYPSDLVGEVHSDGEILMGAWWDTHLLMGADWNITMPLFVEAYYGMQAATFDGNEGEAFTDVLIDLLQADDDDGDITNGTPHGNAIVEGFYLHGITLISNATLTFVDIPFLNTQQNLNLDVFLDLNFPYTQYLSDVTCFYQINYGAWQEANMTSDGSGGYTYDIPGQPAGTIVAYYFGAHDVNNSVSGVIPIGAHLNPFPNLPYFTLVGVQEIGTHDSDNNADFGQWQTGVNGDNNTTGTWVEDTPIGSFTTDVSAGTMVQVDNQHTPGGEFCFVTGNANATDGIGANDVDGGKTTLQTPVINMSNLADPVVAYWRYYTNNPPGGANPGLDYWQVRISNDAGATWTYVENTRTADMSWRRNAFHVSDYVTPTAQMRMQFIASDSLFVGTNLDGGSLIEAALDDFILYDKLIIGVEDQQRVDAGFFVFPNPSHGQASVRNVNEQSFTGSVEVVDALGRVVWSAANQTIAAGGVMRLDLSTLADGHYMIRLMNQGTQASYPLQLRK
ncbi:MAG: T9SS type A sorting domain-containing protein, partial [Flavobacteriales bacterium]